MKRELEIDGRDLPLKSLWPLNSRPINLKSNAGFRKIVASIRTIGLIEPLAVYAEGRGGSYQILDGYLRYKACEELKIESVPCLVYKDMQAYSFNKNVNRLSSSQEMRMLQKSLETIDEATIAKTFGIQSIRYRLAPKLVQNLHPHVVQAFEDDLISKVCAMEFTYVLPERQVEILGEMKKLGDYTRAFCRSFVMRTPVAHRSKKQPQPKPWAQNDVAKKDLINRLEHAEKQHDFYARLYRQYSTDLLRLIFYVRQLITNAKVAEYLKFHHGDIFTRFDEIIFETGERPNSGTSQ